MQNINILSLADVINVVRGVVGEVKSGELSVEEIDSDSPLWESADGASLGLDSLDVLDILLTLEEKYDVELLDDIDPDLLSSIKALAQLVVDRIDSPAPAV